MPRNRRKSVMDPIMKKLAKFTLFLPARIVLFLYTEFTGDNFWEIWSAIKSGAYHDEMCIRDRPVRECFLKILN